VERAPCDPEKRNTSECRVYQITSHCFEDIHHHEWPARDYKTELEKEYRELHILKTLGCRAIHNEIHATTPPPQKPTVAEMREAVNQDRIEKLIERSQNGQSTT